ncbi:hypothetical protein F0562_003984 [Nyssa sinensis]|uniref:Pentatricopeptide repeat-containing protein n=1 Tax=Nyssa sinensis TaxID=561372 RepID=A0A5J5BWY0_9ASTE|nr:hypothetical protein F0562_003984 [Nyssa sinensis]
MHGLHRQGVLLVITRAAFPTIRYFFGGVTCRHQRDSYDYTHLLQHCRCIKSIKEVHAQILIGGYEQNQFLAAKLVGKYTEHSASNMEDARKVFDCLLDRDVFLWNMVIQGYANSGPFAESLNIYDEMWQSGIPANRYTFTFVLKACGAMKDGNKGRVIHGHVVKSGFDFDLFVGNALVAFYAKCQEIETSRRIFEELPQKDLVSWNSMISGYSVNGCAVEALMLFCAMLQDVSTPTPDRATLVGILPACVQAAAIQEGLRIHSYILKSGMEIDAALGSGLIAMYANCGRLKSAQVVFDQISDKNIVVWNAIIRCYGMHGNADEAFKLFSRLLELGLRPDGVIFLCLLSTCSHAGMVAKGWELFEKMGDYGVERNHEHYACMVDLLGRAGFLDQAVEFIKSMPVQAGKDVYGALLGACRVHNNIELAEEVAEKLIMLDPENAGRYIILAKMYDNAGRLEDVARMRKVLREKKIKKQHGCSSIEVDFVLHTFGVEDESHPSTEQIFNTLARLERVMEEE